MAGDVARDSQSGVLREHGLLRRANVAGWALRRWRCSCSPRRPFGCSISPTASRRRRTRPGALVDGMSDGTLSGEIADDARDLPPRPRARRRNRRRARGRDRKLPNDRERELGRRRVPAADPRRRAHTRSRSSGSGSARRCSASWSRTPPCGRSSSTRSTAFAASTGCSTTSPPRPASRAPRGSPRLGARSAAEHRHWASGSAPRSPWSCASRREYFVGTEGIGALHAGPRGDLPAPGAVCGGRPDRAPRPRHRCGAQERRVARRCSGRARSGYDAR